ncbi:MAG TPA: hypothetical protein VJ859_02850 [Allosphingosinicella sp.]|nr:hypothetical protein [Allosphingosinicella sp.]
MLHQPIFEYIFNFVARRYVRRIAASSDQAALPRPMTTGEEHDFSAAED